MSSQAIYRPLKRRDPKRRFAMTKGSSSRTFVNVGCSYVLPACKKSVGIPGAIDVEADQLIFVVEPIDGSGPDAVGVID